MFFRITKMNRPIALPLVFILALSFLLISPCSAPAAPSAEKAYSKASDRLARLEKDKRRRKRHDQWELCIAGFDAVIKGYPGSGYAAKAMYSKAEAETGMYRVSHAQPDLDAAVETYQQYLAAYPAGTDSGSARAKLKSLTGVAPSASPSASARAPKAPAADIPPETVNIQAVAVKNAAAPMKITVQETEDKSPGLVSVSELRHWSNTGYTKIIVYLTGEVKFSARKLKRPDRLFFDLKGSKLSNNMPIGKIDIGDGILKSIRASQYDSSTVRIVFDLVNLSSYHALMLSNPAQLLIDITGNSNITPAKMIKGRGRLITLRAINDTSPKAKPLVDREPPVIEAAVAPGHDEAVEAAPSRLSPAELISPATDGQAGPPASEPVQAKQPAQASPATAPPVEQTAPTPAPASVQVQPAAEQREEKPLYMAGKEKICIGTIVIDPGHGGKDTGAIGRSGLCEKDVVLDVGLRLRDIIREQLACKVVMTRDSDVFIDLNARPGIAVQQDADLFISIHANASKSRDARGIETYLLNLTKDRNIMEVAARENMSTIKDMGDLEVILKDLILDSKRGESLELAHAVQGKLVSDLQRWNSALNDKGVKQGPFLVLYGASMPSILTEVGFISNPEEEALLATPQYRQKIAQAIFDGIKEYISTAKVASSKPAQ